MLGLLAAAVLLRNCEPLGVTSELSRLARFLGNHFALLPERMGRGLDAIRGSRVRVRGKVCSREDFFLYAPSSLVHWGPHSWQASLNSNGLRPRELFWHSSGRRISGLGSNGLLWLHHRHVAFGDSRLIAFGLALRSRSARWDSPWLARAEEIPQEERTTSLTNPVFERFWRISRAVRVCWVRQAKSPVLR